jgi:phosphonate transport system substrate-binding protein
MTLRFLLPPSVGPARALARAELLDQSLRADLAEPIEVEVARDYADLAERAVGGDAHLVWMPPTLCARLESSVRDLYKCQRFGGTTYRSAVVVPRGSARTLSALRGKRFAWVDRLSVGGYLLARAELRAAGLDLSRDLGEQSFVGSYPQALAEVVEGRADATAVTVRDATPASLRDALASYGGRRAADALASVCVSGESPNDAIALTHALEPRRAKRLRERVFERDGARARAALCLALDAEGFVHAKPGEYAPLRALLPL